ncbi:hypothetical protein FRB94_013681 [Tulasnella sp. JGI-2019a]|nr:hypothetical protein FRB94_013681 [Tulasnella sp. JGI-2019a]KAG9033525.1 hypothetical protein FRB95_014704 [Tulasnella sp. JGI-2019a]
MIDTVTVASAPPAVTKPRSDTLRFSGDHPASAFKFPQPSSKTKERESFEALVRPSSHDAKRQGDGMMAIQGNVVYERDNVLGPGLQANDVYDAQMGGWRAAIRRVLVKNLQKESEWLGAMQDRIRTPWLDTYFVYTSSLGTHTFFMTFLPALYFFGYDKQGFALVNQLASGVYLSSLVKDLICSPRPFAPPVTRLTIGNHHLEYGFPSTHSTNSVSIGLYFGSLLYEKADSLPGWAYVAGQVFLVWYMFSIVFGRLYCAMHSFSDCLMGVLLGSGVFAVHWALGPMYWEWLTTAGWQAPFISILLCLFLVNQHAEPVDDCPCFEDAIAFASVMTGIAVSVWFRARWGFDAEGGFYATKSPETWLVWVGVAVVKMVVGILIIFGWRLIAKNVLHKILPPIFRGLSTMFTLPTRRFYTPATDYKKYPQESVFHRPIPSVIDLPAMNEDQMGGGGLPVTVRRRGPRRNENGGEKSVMMLGEASGGVSDAAFAEREDSKRYDANVLTKVIVYGGIAFLAAGATPVLFELVGLGVYQT